MPATYLVQFDSEGRMLQAPPEICFEGDTLRFIVKAEENWAQSYYGPYYEKLAGAEKALKDPDFIHLLETEFGVPKGKLANEYKRELESMTLWLQTKLSPGCEFCINVPPCMLKNATARPLLQLIHIRCDEIITATEDQSVFKSIEQIRITQEELRSILKGQECREYLDSLGLDSLINESRQQTINILRLKEIAKTISKKLQQDRIPTEMFLYLPLPWKARCLYQFQSNQADTVPDCSEASCMNGKCFFEYSITVNHTGKVEYEIRKTKILETLILNWRIGHEFESDLAAITKKIAEWQTQSEVVVGHQRKKAFEAKISGAENKKMTTDPLVLKSLNDSIKVWRDSVDLYRAKIDQAIKVYEKDQDYSALGTIIIDWFWLIGGDLHTAYKTEMVVKPGEATKPQGRPVEAIQTSLDSALAEYESVRFRNQEDSVLLRKAMADYSIVKAAEALADTSEWDTRDVEKRIETDKKIDSNKKTYKFHPDISAVMDTLLTRATTSREKQQVALTHVKKYQRELNLALALERKSLVSNLETDAAEAELKALKISDSLDRKMLTALFSANDNTAPMKANREELSRRINANTVEMLRIQQRISVLRETEAKEKKATAAAKAEAEEKKKTDEEQKRIDRLLYSGQIWVSGRSRPGLTDKGKNRVIEFGPYYWMRRYDRGYQMQAMNEFRETYIEGDIIKILIENSKPGDTLGLELRATDFLEISPIVADFTSAMDALNDALVANAVSGSPAGGKEPIDKGETPRTIIAKTLARSLPQGRGSHDRTPDLMTTIVPPAKKFTPGKKYDIRLLIAKDTLTPRPAETIRINKKYLFLPIAGLAFGSNKRDDSVSTSSPGIITSKYQAYVQPYVGIKWHFIKKTRLADPHFFVSGMRRPYRTFDWSKFFAYGAVSLTHPLKDIYTGIGIEPVSGFSVNVGYHFHYGMRPLYVNGNFVRNEEFWDNRSCINNLYLSFSMDPLIFVRVAQFITSPITTGTSKKVK